MGISTKKPPAPSESSEQKALFEWAAWNKGRYLGLHLMYHIANGGARHPATGARLKAEGVKRGTPDVHLPVPRGQYAGLWIELKAKKGGRLAPEQLEWIEALREHGHAVAVCYGCDDAVRVIKEYYALGANLLTKVEEGDA